MTGKVAWKEGLALLPQHFQRADASAREDLLHSFGCPPSRAFGFSRLRLDESAIAGFGAVEVRSCAGFFPGGLRFDSEVGGGRSLRRVLPEGLGTTHSTLTAYLAMPCPKDGAANLGDEASAYVEYHEELADTATGRSRRQVGLMSPNLSIRFSSESNDGFLLLPLCRIARGKQGTPALDEDFHPTVLDIHAAPRLVEALRALANQMRHRCADLERQNPSIDAPGLRHWLEALHLRSTLPLLDYFAGSQEIHPERVFAHLLHVAGGLGYTRGAESHRPEYRHAEMAETLGALVAHLFRILSSELKTDNLVLGMTRPQPQLFVAKPELETWQKARRVHLAVRSSVPVDQLVQLVNQKAKAAPMSRLQAIIMSALPGIEVRMTPPPGFFRATGQICFELVPDGPLWQALLEEGTIGVFAPVDLDISSIELLVEGG